MTEQLALFDYAALAPDVRDEVQVRTESIRGRLRTAAEDIRIIGGELIAVKAAIGHGQFLAWITAEFEMSQSTANRFMAVAQKFVTVTSLNGMSARALYMLSAPSVPEEARAEALERATGGETITHKAALAIVANHKPVIDPEPDNETPASLGFECFECGRPLEDQYADCSYCADAEDDIADEVERARSEVLDRHQQAMQEAADVQAVLDAAPDDGGRLANASLRLAYSRGVKSVYALRQLDPEQVAAVLRDGDIDAARWFIADTTAWLERFGTALSRGLHIVGGDRAHG